MYQPQRQGFSLNGSAQRHTVTEIRGSYYLSEAPKSIKPGIFSVLASIALVGGIIWGAKKVLG